jgi:hypothetical protein
LRANLQAEGLAQIWRISEQMESRLSPMNKRVARGLVKRKATEWLPESFTVINARRSFPK